ncbi:MAG: hypothetical protein WBC52_04880 [Candidatus Omnitrophota bacterium]
MNWILFTILISIDIILFGVLIMCVCNFDKLVRFWMKQMVVLLILLFPMSAFGAGTWDHRIVKVKPNGNVIVEFIRQITKENINVTFSRVIGDGSEQLARKKWQLEVAWSRLNSFDLGENSKEILIMLIKAVRNNPNLTVTQVTTWYDTTYPDSPWKGLALLKRMQDKIEEEIHDTVDWDKFKTYVINHLFEGVDNY